MRSLRSLYILCCLFLLLPLNSRGQQQKQDLVGNSHSAQNRTAISTSASAQGGETSREVSVRFPLETDRASMKIVLNGKDVRGRFREDSCTGAICLAAELAAQDGVASGRNVLYATAKGQDGTASSSRVHFFGADTRTESGVRRATAPLRTMAAAAPLTGSNLPTNSIFLPPSVLFQTIGNGGVASGQPWFTLGSLQQVVNGNCASVYSVIVLDRRTLQQKTGAPEISPRCFANSSTLVPYLQSLAGNNDIVIVGTNQGQVTDAGSGDCINNPFFDTSAIGGRLYDSSTICAVNGPYSTDVPLTYLAIGVPGASPGSAYENYSTNTNPSPTSFATGMFVEDATGNYNFQSSGNVEFTVSPGQSAAQTSITIFNQPGATPGTNIVYGPPTNAANGFWLLVLSRYDLDSLPGCVRTGSNGSNILIPNCGTFFPLGSDGGDPATIQALANALDSVGSGYIAFLTTVGTAGWGNPGTMASDNNTPNNTIALATALQNYGIPDKSILYTGTSGSAWTMVGTPGLGGPLTGHNLLSSSYWAQQGQTGYIHGTLARDNYGLYQPSHSEQQKSGLDTANLQLGLITSQPPQEWPEYALQPASTSLQGQIDAYKYLSWYLLNGWYVQGQVNVVNSNSAAITGPEQYDIHYFFTGSLNTLLDYHTFDPLNAVFPSQPSPGHTNALCTSTSGSNPVTCNWKGPDGTLLQFTSADFAVVQIQLHNELVALNNVLTYMVTGSTNMKDIVAAGNSNAALTLLQALTTVQANINQPPPPTAPVTVSPWHIMHMVASDVSPFVSFATDGVVNPADIALADKAIGFVGDLFNASGGMGGGLSTVDNNTQKQIPRLDYRLDVTIGQLATADLQGAILAGFDSTLDVITGDYGKLMALGSSPVNQSPLFAPTQATQNQVIQMITKASQKSLYSSLIPQIYQVHKWGMTGQTPTADMGYTKNGDTNSCRAFYNNTTTPYVAAGYPTYGGTSYWETWHTGPNANAQNPFFYNGNPPFVDWYVLSLPFTNAGTTNASAIAMDGTLSGILFGSNQNSVNFVRDEFVAQNGPMDKPLTGGRSSMFDVAYEIEGQNPPYSAYTNPIGLDNGHICSVSQFSAVRSGTPVTGSRDTATVLTMPGSVVLGTDVPMQVKVSISATSAPAAGSVQIRDGSFVLATLPLDASGSAVYTAKGLQLGVRSISAYFISTDGSLPSDSGPKPLKVYAESPDMQLTLSQPTLDVSYNKTSAAVSLKILALSGMSGDVAYACSGLPAGMFCSFSPALSKIADGGTATTSFTISGAPIKATSSSVGFATFWGLLLSAAPLWLLTQKLRNGHNVVAKMALSLLLLFAAASGFVGCGGSTSAPAGSFRETGSRSVLVTATSGTLTRTAPLVVSIQ